MRKNITFEFLKIVSAIALSLLVVVVIIFTVSKEPLAALIQFVTGPVNSARHIGNIFEMAIPLIFTGLAISVMFQAKQFNIGAEGSFYAGAFIAAIVAIKVALPVGLHPMVCILSGAIAGGLICLIPALLEVKWDANVLVSSLMMNYIVVLAGIYGLKYFIRDPNAGSMTSFQFAETALLQNVIPRTRIHEGLFLAVAAIIIVYLFLYKTRWGYEIRITGQNRQFAHFSGVKTIGVILLSQLAGGLLAGIGGSIQALGMYTRFNWTVSPGFGWDGIIVAILARNNPIWVPVGALFLSYIRIGADAMAMNTDVQNEVVAIIQGFVIVLIAAEGFLARRKQQMVYRQARENTQSNKDQMIEEGVG
jgi:ABC-type uncharacterized transport system permease subunit